MVVREFSERNHLRRLILPLTITPTFTALAISVTSLPSAILLRMNLSITLCIKSRLLQTTVFFILSHSVGYQSGTEVLYTLA